MAPLEGKITPAGSGTHPSATRVPWPEGTPGVNAPSRFASEAQPVAAPPALGPRGLPGAPAEQPAADSVEALRAAAAARAQEKAAAAAERRARAAAAKAEIRRRESDLSAREERLKAVEARLQSYRLSPQLALEDLRQYGVSFEQLAQAVADGRGPSLDQLAAVEAQTARREVAELRGQVEKRDREARVAREREAVAIDRQAAAEAVGAYKSELRATAEADAAKYPLVSRTLERGVLDQGFEIAEAKFAELRRTPSPDEVLGALEETLEREFAEFQGALSGRGAAPPPTPRGSPAFTPRESSGSPADRRAWFLKMLQAKLGSGR